MSLKNTFHCKCQQGVYDRYFFYMDVISSMNVIIKKFFFIQLINIKSTNRFERPLTQSWRHSGIFIVNFEHILHLVLVFLLLTLNM